MRKPLFGLLLAGALCAAGWFSAAAAQDTSTANQEPSIADAARKARAERKEQPPAKQVWTDDNLPKVPHEVPPAATEGGGEAAAEAGAGDKGAAKPVGSAEDENKEQADLEAKWRDKFALAHRKLDDDQKDLDLMERELSLKRQQYYSDPNTAMREQYQYPSGRGGDINDLVKKIDAKKQQIEQDKQAISDLEDQLRKDGLPSGWARP
jgi:hypothetical protein